MKRRTLLRGIAVAFAGPCTALAGETAHSRTALVALGQSDAGPLAGLAITLQPGWKTYWRMPGVAGVPPEFDWSGSKNLKSVSPKFPMPKRYADAADETIGYKDEVIFPLAVEPEDKSKPVRLNLTLNYAVCDEVCMPASDKLALDLSQAPLDPRAEQWLAAIPQAVQDVVKSAAIVEEGNSLFLALALNGEASDIFVESKTLAYFGKPEPGASPHEYRLPIYNIKDLAKLKGQALLMTLALADRNVEQAVTLP